MPNFEAQENLPVTDQDIIEKFKEGGAKNPEAINLLQKWTAQNEAEAEALGTARAKIEALIKQATLYHKLQLNEYWDSLNNARRMAFQENDTEAYNKIMNLMDLADEGKELD